MFGIGQLRNPGILTGKLPQDLLDRVKKAVNSDAARKCDSVRHRLVANILEEYETPEIDGFRKYLDEMYAEWKSHFKVENIPYVIDPIWTNYMKKGEFNPNHIHPGALAVFVLWVTIPYNIEDEMKFNSNSNSRYPSKNSCFEFTYSKLDGRIDTHPIYVDKSMEGAIVMFPSTLTHCVYPFYTSDKERISIAGNILPASVFEK